MNQPCLWNWFRVKDHGRWKFDEGRMPLCDLMSLSRDEDITDGTSCPLIPGCRSTLSNPCSLCPFHPSIFDMVIKLIAYVHEDRSDKYQWVVPEIPRGG